MKHFLKMKRWEVLLWCCRRHEKGFQFGFEHKFIEPSRHDSSSHLLWQFFFCFVHAVDLLFGFSPVGCLIFALIRSNLRWNTNVWTKLTSQGELGLSPFPGEGAVTSTETSTDFNLPAARFYTKSYFIMWELSVPSHFSCTNDIFQKFRAVKRWESQPWPTPILKLGPLPLPGPLKRLQPQL